MSSSKNILIGCTGSVATIKLPDLVNGLQQLATRVGASYEIRVIVTEHAKHFYNPDDLPEIVKVYSDSNEWSTWKVRGDPVLHIELSKWADVMVIAPLDANSLAKMATGICDNLLLCTTRAWNMDKPLLFCPAMNTRMFEHPITQGQIDTLKDWGHTEIPCVTKTLMCGDTGLGAMADVGTIVTRIHQILS